MLKDSIGVLIQEKADAYRFAYNDAFAKYDTRTSQYISTLENPCVSMFPNKATAVLAGTAGAILGVAVGAVVVSATQ